jgi:actin-related protein
MIPTIVGFSKIVKINSNQAQKDEIYVGLDALKRSPLLSLKYPIEHGIILDWDEITLLLEHVFK